MRKKGLALCCFSMLLLAAGLSGCRGSGGMAPEGESASKKERSLTVYYVQGDDYYEKMLARFQGKYRDITLNLCAFKNAGELARQYAAEGLSGNGADVVLVNAETELDLNRLMENGSCLPLTEYLEANGVYDEEKYNVTVLEAGQLDGEQYILPFTYDTGLIAARDSVYALTGKDFAGAEDFAAFMELLTEVQQELSDSEDIRLSICLDIADSTAEAYLAYMYRISGLDLLTADPETEQEAVRLVCDAARNLKTEFDDRYAELKNSGSNSAYLTGYLGCFGNPAYWVRFYEMSTEYVTGETLSFDGIPGLGRGGVHGTVRDCGFVSRNTQNPEDACLLLQYTLDYDYNAFQYGSKTGTPVNRIHFQNQLKLLAGWSKLSLGGQSMYVSKMSDADMEKVQAMEAAVSSASLIHCETEAILGEAMAAYVEGTANFEDCYTQLKQRIKVYMQE